MNSWRNCFTADSEKVVMTGRTKILFIFLSVWFLAITFRLGYLASGFSRRFRISSETISGRVYRLPAMRGNIIDGSGRILVWSEKHYDLTFQGTLSYDELETLRKLLPERRISFEMTMDSVIDSLTSDELAALEKLLRNTPALHVVTRLERRCVQEQEVLKLAGKLNSAGKGVSGWEKEFDSILSGRDGSFRVTRDSRGRWIRSSGEIVNMPIPGRDVKVKYPAEKGVGK